jgi:hypothetical protein
MPPKQIKQSRRPQAIQSENVSKLKIKASIPQRLLVENCELVKLLEVFDVDKVYKQL